MDEEKVVALIVLNYNDSQTTEKFIKETKRLNSIDYIVVVDNHSTDDSFNTLSSYSSPSVLVIQTDSNRGYAYGNNYGTNFAIKKLHASYIFVANPDVEINNDNIDQILSILVSKKNAGQVTCRMCNTSSISLPIAWKLPEYSDCLLECCNVLKKIIPNRTFYESGYFSKTISEVDVVPGSFFGIRAKTFKDVGGFDEDTFLYYEENIIAFKLKEKGYKNYLINTSEYIHRHSATIDKTIKSTKKKLEIAQDSRRIYVRKYLRKNNFCISFLNVVFKLGLIMFILYKKIQKNKNERISC